MVAKISFLKKSVAILGLTVLLSTDVMTMVMIGRCFQMQMVADASSMGYNIIFNLSPTRTT